MVDAISAVKAISASSESVPVNAEKSMSIDSEPDNRYVAWRQAQINAALIATNLARGYETTGAANLWQAEDEASEDTSDRRAAGHLAAEPHNMDERRESQVLSGESDHIGTVDFDDDTPFGGRTAYI